MGATPDDGAMVAGDSVGVPPHDPAQVGVGRWSPTAGWVRAVGVPAVVTADWATRTRAPFPALACNLFVLRLRRDFVPAFGNSLIEGTGLRHPGRGRRPVPAQPLPEDQSENFSDLAHGDSGSGHRHLSSDIQLGLPEEGTLPSSPHATAPPPSFRVIGLLRND